MSFFNFEKPLQKVYISQRGTQEEVFLKKSPLSKTLHSIRSVDFFVISDITINAP
jgi:hypothetical protein